MVLFSLHLRLINLLYSTVQACFALTNRVLTIVAIPGGPVYSKPKYLNLSPL